MGFTDRAKVEQSMLKYRFPNLYKYYDEYLGNICISDNVYRTSPEIRKEMQKLVEQKTEVSRYVMYRDLIPDEKGKTEMGWVLSQADIVE